VTPQLVLYLFGTPGQRRFWDLWEGLAEGAVGALVLVDTRRLEQSFEVLDQLETQTAELPFAVAVNHFPDSPRYEADELVEALDLPPRTPVVDSDARDHSASAKALITLVEHALSAQKVASA
jgi:signal recognition particle receptor subunit beta